MARKGSIVFISGWLVALTILSFVWEPWRQPAAPALQAGLFLLAVIPVAIAAVLFRLSTPRRSVTQILYDLEHPVDAAAREEGR